MYYMKSTQDNLLNNGYCIIDNIISNNMLCDLRNRYLKHFTNDATLTCDEFLQDEELSSVLFSDVVFGTIKEVIGDNFYLYPDFTLRKNLYIPWHNDTPYLTENERQYDIFANMVQASIYLQDNTIENGGGLDVVPGSHHVRSFSGVDFDTAEIMPSKSGSLVLWDSRIWHKSREQTDCSKTHPKLAIQWTLSRNSRFSNHFLEYLKDRILAKRQHVIDINSTRELKYLTSILGLSYPKSFCTQHIETIKRNNVNMLFIRENQ